MTSVAYEYPLAQSRALREMAASSNLSCVQCAVFTALGEFRDCERLAWPSVKTLARLACCCERSVQQALSVLLRKGLITVVAPATAHSTTRYRIRMPSAQVYRVSCPVPPSQESSPHTPLVVTGLDTCTMPEVPELRAVPEAHVVPEARTACEPEVHPVHPKEPKEENKNARTDARAHVRRAQDVPEIKSPSSPVAPMTRRERSDFNRQAHAERSRPVQKLDLKPASRPISGPTSVPKPRPGSKPVAELPPQERAKIIASLQSWRLDGCKGPWKSS